MRKVAEVVNNCRRFHVESLIGRLLNSVERFQSTLLHESQSISVDLIRSNHSNSRFLTAVQASSMQRTTIEFAASIERSEFPVDSSVDVQ